MHAVVHARANRVRVGGAVAQQRGGEGARDRRLARAGGPVEQVGVAGPAVGRQRAVEDGAGVGVTLGGGEHLWKATAMRGQLITIEGLDGTGKTTLADALADALRADGREVVLLREPGGVELSERIRALVKDPALRVDPRAEALLYAAARAQLVAERVEPALARGHVGAARSLRRLLAGLPGRGARAGDRGGARRQPRSPPAACAPIARCCCAPTRPRARRARPCAARRPTVSSARTTPSSTAIAGAYDALAAAEPERFRVLDAGAEPAAVLRAALAALADLG